MREIKFRAWDKKKKSMIPHGRLFSLDCSNEYPFLALANGFYADEFSVEVMQFTGLRDKNGKEIYEGDYLRCKKYVGGNFVEHCYELGYVEFLHGAFGLHRKQGFYRPFKDWLEDYELEVIGNIYEHPELFK